MADLALELEARIAEFERQFEREGARVQRLLNELCTGNKILSVSVVETKDGGDNAPMFITLRIDPPKIAVAETNDGLVVELEGADRGSYH